MDPDFDFDSLIADYQEFDEPPPSQDPDELFVAEEWEEQRAGVGPAAGPRAASSDRAIQPTDPNGGPGTPTVAGRADSSRFPDDGRGGPHGGGAAAADDGSLDSSPDRDGAEHDEEGGITVRPRQKKDPYAFER